MVVIIKSPNNLNKIKRRTDYIPLPPSQYSYINNVRHSTYLYICVIDKLFGRMFDDIIYSVEHVAQVIFDTPIRLAQLSPFIIINNNNISVARNCGFDILWIIVTKPIAQTHRHVPVSYWDLSTRVNHCWMETAELDVDRWAVTWPQYGRLNRWTRSSEIRTVRR